MNELDWAAGFFDGEGCFYIQRVGGGKYLYPAINIRQAKDPEVLHRFKSAVKFGTIYGPYRPSSVKPRHSEFWNYMVSGERATEVIKLLLPYLSSTKRNQGTGVLVGLGLL